MNIHKECLEGNLANVEDLLKQGTDLEALDTVDDDLMTPLLAAVNGNHPAVVMCLLKAGADPNNAPSRLFSDCPLIHACDNGYKDIAIMLMAAGADVNQEGDDEGINGHGDKGSALLYALQSEHTEVAEFLLAAGADKTHHDNEGVTPLWLAAMTGNLKILKILLADPDVNVNVKPNMQPSALKIACEMGAYETAHELARDPRIDQNGNGYREYTRIRERKRKRRERRMVDQLARQRLPPGLSRQHIKPNIGHLQDKTTLKF